MYRINCEYVIEISAVSQQTTYHSSARVCVHVHTRARAIRNTRDVDVDAVSLSYFVPHIVHQVNCRRPSLASAVVLSPISSRGNISSLQFIRVSSRVREKAGAPVDSQAAASRIISQRGLMIDRSALFDRNIFRATRRARRER